jgi:alginate O-acetyltransferase complex protein AlgI
MTGASVYLALCSLLGVGIIWALPRSQGLNAVAGLTLIAIALISPASALWLAGTTFITVSIIRHYPFRKHRGLVVTLYGFFLVFLLFVTREMPGYFWVGGAYFTLRHMHVLIDWWMGKLNVPTLTQYARYSFFLPVIMAGPIHRLGNFQRQEERQRVNATNLFNGAERALFGLFQAVVISSWLLRRLRQTSEKYSESWPLFLQRWTEGGFDWLQLFFSFSGLTSLALGVSLMMGLKLEENFNRPWASKNLIDFWTRWHMTLSNWCRDYVFYPVTAITRLPLVGLLMAMLAMGLWHDNSAYYILWAVWQSLGIFLTHLVLRLGRGRLPESIGKVIGPISVFVWLTLTKPVVLEFLNLISS